MSKPIKGVGAGDARGGGDKDSFRPRSNTTSSIPFSDPDATRRKRGRGSKGSFQNSVIDTESVKNKVNGHLVLLEKADIAENVRSSALVQIITVLLGVVTDLGDAVNDLRDDQQIFDNEYASVAKKATDSNNVSRELLNKAQKSDLVKDLENAQMSIKILDFGYNCGFDKLGQKGVDARADLEQSDVAKNYLRGSRFSTFFNCKKEDRPTKSNGKSAPVGVIIKCDSLDKKRELYNHLKNDSRNFVMPYYWPSCMVKGVKAIRSGFEAMKGLPFQAKNAQLLIRPSASFTSLVVKYRLTASDAWTSVAVVPASPYDDRINKDLKGRLPHVKEFQMWAESLKTPNAEQMEVAQEDAPKDKAPTPQ